VLSFFSLDFVNKYFLKNFIAFVSLLSGKPSYLWVLLSTNFGHTKKSQKMKHEPILEMGSDRIIPRNAYHKPFTVKFPDKCKWQNVFNPDNKGGLVWYMDVSKTNTGTGAGVYRWGLRKWG
jgi:hypothetical protein